MLASAVAFTVTISLAPLAVIEVAAEPVVMLMPLSAALPVVTVSAPVREPAAIFPTSPVTVSAAEPLSVKAVFCANAVAVTVTISLAPLAVIEVAAEPVVMMMPVVGRIPRRHRQRTGQRASRDIPDQPGHRLRRRADQRQRRILRQRRRVTVTISLAKLAVIEVAAEPVVIDMLLSAASPVVTVSAPVREPAAISPTSPVTVSAAEPTASKPYSAPAPPH